MSMQLVIVMLLLLHPAGPLGARDVAPLSRAKPPTYYEDKGACPFECCTYREWRVNAPTVFYAKRHTGSRIVFRADKDEPVTGVTGVVITLKLGKAVVRKRVSFGQGHSTRTAEPDEVLHLLHYEGEGFVKFWFRGHIYVEEVHSKLTDSGALSNPRGDGSIHLDREPQTVWWVQVKNQRGQIGWSKQTHHFDHMDACE